MRRWTQTTPQRWSRSGSVDRCPGGEATKGQAWEAGKGALLRGTTAALRAALSKMGGGQDWSLDRMLRIQSRLQILQGWLSRVYLSSTGQQTGRIWTSERTYGLLSWGRRDPRTKREAEGCYQSSTSAARIHPSFTFWHVGQTGEQRFHDPLVSLTCWFYWGLQQYPGCDGRNSIDQKLEMNPLWCRWGKKTSWYLGRKEKKSRIHPEGMCQNWEEGFRMWTQTCPLTWTPQILTVCQQPSSDAVRSEGTSNTEKHPEAKTLNYICHLRHPQKLKKKKRINNESLA